MDEDSSSAPTVTSSGAMSVLHPLLQPNVTAGPSRAQTTGPADAAEL